MILAIRFKACEARLNQAQKTVELGHVVPYKMEKEDWKVLQQRLNKLKSVLESSDKVVKQAIVGLE